MHLSARLAAAAARAKQVEVITCQRVPALAMRLLLSMPPATAIWTVLMAALGAAIGRRRAVRGNQRDDWYADH